MENQDISHVKDAVGLIKFVMTNVEKLNGLSGEEKEQMVMSILTDLAKGKDGISGTKDDLLPPIVIAGLQAMSENNLITSTIELIIDASKGRLDINKVETCTFSLFRCLKRVLVRS